MYKHKLTQSDAWFIEKRRIDTMTRTPFEIGHEVVVCENKHVMLSEFYDGTCPSCGSRNTVPFKRSNIEYVKKIKFRSEPLPRILPSRKAKKLIPKINVALCCILLALVALVVALIYMNVISADNIYMSFDEDIAPDMEQLLLNVNSASAAFLESAYEQITCLIEGAAELFENILIWFQDVGNWFSYTISELLYAAGY